MYANRVTSPKANCRPITTNSSSGLEFAARTLEFTNDDDDDDDDGGCANLTSRRLRGRVFAIKILFFVIV